MYLITRDEKLMLEMYKAIGTPEEIIRRLDHPYPQVGEGYAPCPWANNFEGDGRPDSGLLVDDEFGCPFDDGVGTIDDGVDMSSSPYEGSTIVVDDWGGV